LVNLHHQGHARWRESFKELRAAERKLPESMRGGRVGTDLAAQYEESEARRKHSAELFWGMERQGMSQAAKRQAVGTAAPELETAAPKPAAPFEPPRSSAASLPMIRPSSPAQTERQMLVSSAERPQGD
jgi:hypothetical protein